MSSAQTEQLAISYASFVLSGSGAEVNQESLNAVLKAANVTVSASLVTAVAKALKGKNVSQFFGAVGAGSAPAVQAPAQGKPAPAGKGGKKQQKKVAPPPPPPAEDDDEGMEMGGLFD